jgi:hypothetical protein
MYELHNQMMAGGTGAMSTTYGIVCLVFGLLVLTLLVLSIAALIKYLRKP